MAMKASLFVQFTCTATRFSALHYLNMCTIPCDRSLLHHVTFENPRNCKIFGARKSGKALVKQHYAFSKNYFHPSAIVVGWSYNPLTLPFNDNLFSPQFTTTIRTCSRKISWWLLWFCNARIRKGIIEIEKRLNGDNNGKDYLSVSLAHPGRHHQMIMPRTNNQSLTNAPRGRLSTSWIINIGL